MVNRVLQAKTLKLKRQKRLFPKKYSAGYITVPRAGDATNSMLLMTYAQGKVSGKAFDEEFNRYVDEKHGKRNAEGSRHLGAIAAEEAALRITEQDKVHWPIKFKIIENIYQRAMCYANSGMTCYIIVYENFKTGEVQRSITYQTKERILSQYYSNKIIWVTIKDSS